MKFEWETIDSYHFRAKVIGGWLVKVTEDVSHPDGYGAASNGWDWRIAMAFVPDPSHEWEIEK